MERLLYGVAYYDEYMPYERLEKDVEMMKRAGINLVRIAESTWSTLEPQDNVFDFTHIDRVLEAMGRAGISVIVGTPTYAIPSWMEKKHPDILAETKNGRGIYGARQIMDITNPHYLFYAERVIRRLVAHVAEYPCVIGYQVDNETKHYGTSCARVQAEFVEYLKEKFEGDEERMNAAFGFNYWSNAIHSWEDFPDVRGTINGSLGGEFEKFQRSLVTRFLAWQAKLVRAGKREDQFITHNFDFGWKGHSYGVQPDVDHFAAARCLDKAGCDIYHPSQDGLTGSEIAFCGDLTRGLKKDNYLVLETEAQGFPEWEPYAGQLRLQAFSHLASGADCVEYWHWHSLHNACETYWRGLLSHDLEENETYREAAAVGADFARLSDRLLHLKKENRIAIMVSNEALTGLKWFPMANGLTYNDVVRWLYDGLYEQNFECDIIHEDEEDLGRYRLLLVPALYCAPESTLRRLKAYTEQGGHLLATFKSAFCDENMKVYCDRQPHLLTDCFGVSYQHFTVPQNVGLSRPGEPEEEPAQARDFMECLVPEEDTETLLSYVHPNWGRYSAATAHAFGAGRACYLGCMFEKRLLKKLLLRITEEAGVLPNPGSEGFPVIVRSGENRRGNRIFYFFNYSGTEQRAVCPEGSYTELLGGKALSGGDEITLPAWGFAVLEQNR
ncbi:MAG: beta-galactosidase [Eubacteriales bacterium]|nr:beta-galactosidase [Eubacteriales bacterium]